MWELDCKESWALKNWRFWTVVLEKILENPLDCKRSNLACCYQWSCKELDSTEQLNWTEQDLVVGPIIIFILPSSEAEIPFWNVYRSFNVIGKYLRLFLLGPIIIFILPSSEAEIPFWNVYRSFNVIGKYLRLFLLTELQVLLRLLWYFAYIHNGRKC